MPVHLSAQYFPAAEDEPRWEINTWSFAQFIDKEEIWTLSEQVILEDEVWTPLIRVQHWNPDSPQAPSFTPDTALLGYYRKDGLQIYYRSNHASGSTLMYKGLIYDFALEEGDSTYALGPLNASSDFVQYHVLETGTFDCDGDARKWLHVWFIDGGPIPYGLYHETYWVQGLGDVVHPFIPGNCLELNCESMYVGQTLFLNGDSLSMGWNNFPCVQLVINNQEELFPVKNAVLAVSPNPATEQIMVRFELFEASKVTIRLTDISGREIARSTSEGWFNAGKYQDVVAIEHLLPGMYILVLEHEGGRELSKFIKQ